MEPLLLLHRPHPHHRNLKVRGRNQSQHAQHQSSEESIQADGSRPKTQRQTDKEKGKANDALLLEGARICAVLAQVTAVIERFHCRGDDDASGFGSGSTSNRDTNGRADSENKADPGLMTKRVEETVSLLPRCGALRSLRPLVPDTESKTTSNGTGGEWEQARSQARAKVGRALERLRRAAVKLLDATTPMSRGKVASVRSEKSEDIACVKRLLHGIVGVYEGSSEVSVSLIVSRVLII